MGVKTSCAAIVPTANAVAVVQTKGTNINDLMQLLQQSASSLGADVFLGAAKLSGGHVTLHDVHTVLLIEGDAGDFIEADDIVLAYQAALSVCVVHKHLGDSRLTA